MDFLAQFWLDFLALIIARVCLARIWLESSSFLAQLFIQSNPGSIQGSILAQCSFQPLNLILTGPPILPLIYKQNYFEKASKLT